MSTPGRAIGTVVALLALAIPVPGAGQWAAAARFVEFESQGPLERSYEASAPTADLVVGAALGGMLGIVPGAILGAPLVCATAKLVDPDVTRPSAVLPFIPAMMLITAVAVEQQTSSEPGG